MLIGLKKNEIQDSGNMLTIKNVRRDIDYKDGYQIDEFQLIDGGLSGASSGNLENPFYTFYWSMWDDKRRFKVVVKREPIDKVYYHLWIEDLRMDVRIYNVRVMASLFTDRERFYNWMVDRIRDSLSN
jgi:hypothetical protein